MYGTTAMRYLGAVFVIAALSAMGIAKAAELKTNLQVLQNALLMLELIKSEICTMRVPMIKAVEKAASSCKGSVKSFAECLSDSMDRLGDIDFGTLWRGAAEKTLTSIPQECFDAIVNLGNTLGRYDCQMQAQAIDSCAEILTAVSAKRRDELKNSQKMYVGLYSGAGVIIAVILI